MVVSRTCKALRSRDGQPCEAAPLKDDEYCRFHSPNVAEEVQEGRRVGGQRRRRELAIAGAYEFEGLEDVGSIRRLVEIATSGTLELENSVTRNKALASFAQVAAGLLEKSEFARRLEELESVVLPRKEQRDTERKR